MAGAPKGKGEGGGACLGKKIHCAETVHVLLMQPGSAHLEQGWVEARKDEGQRLLSMAMVRTD